MMDEEITSPKIILYGHSACPGVGPLKGMFKQSNVAYDYINIKQDQDAAAIVRAINNGYESVPTLVFPDGTSLTEPSTGQLKIKLESLGYNVSWLALLIGNVWYIFLLGIILYTLLRFFGII